ncbi:MAG: hypothetical protein WA637_04545 [Terriglobales bacterium]
MRLAKGLRDRCAARLEPGRTEQFELNVVEGSQQEEKRRIQQAHGFHNAFLIQV